MSTELFDLIVVGAGPAGSAAAYTAAEYGLSVLLLEEDQECGKPVVCAEGISRSTIKDYLTIKPEWVSMALKGAIIRGPDHEEFKIEYPNVGYILERTIFDAALAERAKEKGVCIKNNSKAIYLQDNKIIVKKENQTKEYGFKFLIAADGICSHVGQWLGIDTRLNIDEIEVCAQYLIEDIKIEHDYAYFIFGQEYAPGGYAWIFPKSRNAANVGLGISPFITNNKAKYLLDKWVKKEFPGGKITRKIFGGVPAKALKNFSGKNFFLIGDAARFTDPLSGAGIANAIKSGVIAGRNAALRLKGKKDFFIEEIKKEILKEVKYHLKLRKTYIKLSETDYKIIFNVARKIFEGKTVHDINIQAIVKEILSSSPRILWKAIKALF